MKPLTLIYRNAGSAVEPNQAAGLIVSRRKPLPDAHTILVVGRDNELRRSVKFALEAEGFNVVISPRLPENGDPAWPAISCAVVDDSALVGDGAIGDGRVALDWPVVLLADRVDGSKVVARHTLLKPLLGRRLISAVLDSVAMDGRQGVARE